LSHVPDRSVRYWSPLPGRLSPIVLTAAVAMPLGRPFLVLVYAPGVASDSVEELQARLRVDGKTLKTTEIALVVPKSVRKCSETGRGCTKARGTLVTSGRFIRIWL
jgi:hypothetical protein